MKQALVRIAAVLGAVVLLVTSAAFTPLLLRRMDGLRVQRVEVTGVFYMDAAEAVRASGITDTTNVFDDPTPWLESLRTHPFVADVSVERRVPGTLVLNITESVPVAFARTPELRPIDARGRVLPADPATEHLDLPVLALQTRVTADAASADEETRKVVAFLGRMATLEPGLTGWVSEAGLEEGAVRLVLRNSVGTEVLIDADAAPSRLRELHLTIADLAGSQAADSTGTAADLAQVRRIDVRYHDQVVVALHGRKN